MKKERQTAKERSRDWSGEHSLLKSLFLVLLFYIRKASSPQPITKKIIQSFSMAAIQGNTGR
jgi:hypothetical protein